MRRPFTYLLALIATLAFAGVVSAAETTLTASLIGDAETDEDGSGTASVTLDPDAGTACWDLSVEDIDPVTQSHIHEGGEGESGDVIVPLDTDGFEGSSEGCIEDQDADALQAIIDDPSGYYVNVHNDAFPAGAIRGQLAAGQPDTALPRGDATPALFGAVLLGLAVVAVLRLWRTVPVDR